MTEEVCGALIKVSCFTRASPVLILYPLQMNPTEEQAQETWLSMVALLLQFGELSCVHELRCAESSGLRADAAKKRFADAKLGQRARAVAEARPTNAKIAQTAKAVRSKIG